MSRFLFAVSLSTMASFLSLPIVGAFNIAANTNLAVYWGQNSYGATNPSNTANWQQSIGYYCQDATVDIIPMAFLDIFNTTGGLPSVNLANTCSTSSNGVFPGTQLPNCTFLAQGIQTCQNAGKIVTISLGGATGASTFANDAQGQAFAQIIWDLFLGGTSTTRPFGNAVLDGIDMDIEGGSQTGYTAFLTTLRQLMDGGSKPYYITAAPQCPYPDAYIGNTINAVPFDAVFVQFYNNYCGLNNYGNTNDWNFATWDNWAKTVSPNPNVKVFIGAPAASSAAGSGYVDASTITTIIQQTRSQYSSFGGVMMWDMSQAYANNRYDVSVKDALTGGGSVPTTTTKPVTSTTPATSSVPATSTTPVTTSTSTNPVTTSAPATSAKSTTTTSTSTTTTAGTGSCAGVSPWVSDVAYVGGNQVTYNGDLWTAQWWTYNDTPGGPAGVWVNDGPCTTGAATAEIRVSGNAAQATFSAIATSRP
ncbi:glycoside hydrolase superfamily [Boletus edulis BED1]|uniref:chitinase n=1 Tax=Boletus edulis BED1 TaxID=1328754 RepID=A0AAD4G5L7_BOLED|nr:glycoside hydrolase superfamily [Boletus edulis BED1]